MVDWALGFSAALMGLAGTPHCAAMCGPACAAACDRSGPQAAAFQGGRLLAYSAAGAAAAASTAWLAQASQTVAMLRPLWVLLQAAGLALGLWLLWKGQQPVWLERIGQRRPGPPTAAPEGWQRIRMPARSAAVGIAWVAWPCGLLQSALLLAALASGPLGGALVMGSFALASAPGLLLVPLVWRRLAPLGPDRAVAQGTLPIRLAGLMLSAASAWALGHGVWLRVAAWCAT